MLTKADVDTSIEEMYEQVIDWRRYLHQHPELSFQEVKTSEFVYETLHSFGPLEITRPTKTSVMARLKGDKPGKTLALRADMDGLPIQEETGLPYSSKNAGVMHACAHDGHTAMLLGAAKILCSLKEEIEGEIVFLFQHAEEVPPGGAREMVEANVLEGVDNVFGLHLMTTIPFGKIGIKEGAITSYSDTFDITIKGIGGHASTPELTADSITAGAQIVSGLQHIISRSVAPLENAVVSVTRIHSGDAYNVIPAQMTIGGSVRALDGIVRDKVKRRIEEVVQGISAAHNVQGKVHYEYGYASVKNHTNMTNDVAKIIEERFPANTLEWIDPMLGGEDFAAFVQEKPGCYVMVGAGDADKGKDFPHHHPKFDINEEAMKHGLKLHVYSALSLTDNKEV
ncbi:amidohydrolase [Alteribacillus sp. JSM 102045]|uniref:amidohydrolase n=1 Tax=Alteribacillus sp. JSM 102045 TaxID=1562101 RepID=UPI0035BEC5B0